ncbi:TraX family protein [Vibrio diabolicus]|uniref:TraX family protein n=1 Tax=Vibrio diabolicus TaxID=50719 RepID=UPI002493E013|nr:TraX family protein [Vibrio diabolicus]
MSTHSDSAQVKQTVSMPNLVISNGTIEGLKILGVILMVGDHVNKYLFNGTLPYLFEAGRLALPIFVFVLAYNLARPGQFERGTYERTMKRLAVFGVIASIPFMALGGLYDGWWPLNILFTLLAITATAYFIERKQFFFAFLVFINAGTSVEFWWPAMLLGLAIWAYLKQPSLYSAGIAVLACAGLGYANENMWALAALPILASSTMFDLKVPRIRWAFYAFYPLHLGLLWLIRIPMSQAGYLFF